MKKNPFLTKKEFIDPHSGKYRVHLVEGGFLDMGNGLVATKHGVSTYDPKMIEIEIYNRGKEDAILSKMEPHRPGPETIICKKDEWTLVPHCYYIPRTASGAPYDFLVNYGKSKRIGNKKASRPE